MKVIFTLGASLFIGCALTLHLLQNDEQCKHIVRQKLKQAFEATFFCDAAFELKKIDLLRGKIQAENVLVSDPNKTWSWQAKEFCAAISWFSLLITRKLSLAIKIDEICAESLIVNGVPTISEHVKKLIIDPSDVSIILKDLSIEKGSLELSDTAKNVEGTVAFSVQTNVRTERLKCFVYITDATVLFKKTPLLQSAQTNLTLDVSSGYNTEVNTALVQLSGGGKLTLAHMPEDEKDCYLTMNFDGDRGSLRLHNKDGSFENKLEFCPEHVCIITSTMSIDFFSYLLDTKKSLSGLCHSSIKVDYKNEVCVDGVASIVDAAYEGVLLGDLKTTFCKRGCSWEGTALFDRDSSGSLKGDWRWNTTAQQGDVGLRNTTRLQSKLTYWSIAPQGFQISCSFNPIDQFKATHQFVATHGILETKAKAGGSCSVRDQVANASGSFGDTSYMATAELFPAFAVKSITCFDEQKRNIFSVGLDGDSGDFAGRVNYQCVRTLLQSFFDLDMRGEGCLDLEGSVCDRIISGTVSMQDVHIQVPQTYNFIRNLEMGVKLDVSEGTLTFHNARLELQKGVVESQRATVAWDECENAFFVHIPVIFHQIFLNFEKDLFAEVSGSMLLQKTSGRIPQLTGSISMDRGQCKKNLFSPLLQKNLVGLMANPLGYNKFADCQVLLKTKKPLRIQTPFLQTDASLDISIKNNITHPCVSGKVSLSSGTLAFPYRPLYIVRGKLYLLPYQLDDPVIELIAKGSVKHYTITLQVSGSLQHPHITLQSMPALTEEQIITLLLSGLEEGSVALAMPTVIMQNLENILFDPDQPQSKLEGYFKNLLGPLKHVRVVPNFFDQTARGGFRGAFDIDVSERLHALIQKNFSLTEDTLVEFEYLLSDDVTIRGIKDQRGDIGGEVEMRWKF